MALPCGLTVGGGSLFPEFPPTAIRAAADGPGPMPPGDGKVLESVAAQTGGAVLDLDLTASRWPEDWQEGLRHLQPQRNSGRRRRRPAVAVRVTVAASQAHAVPLAGAALDILNLELEAGLGLFRMALRAADLRGVLAAVAAVAAPAAAEAAAAARDPLEREGVVLGAASARRFVQEIIACAGQPDVAEAVCAIALATCAVPVLAALEAGAAGPAREGAWESLYVRAIAGCPVSLSAARPWEPAVLAGTDLWHGPGPAERTVSECLALRRGEMPIAPGPLPSGAMARILSAEAISSIAEAIQTCQQPYQRAVAAAYAAATLIGESSADASLGASDREFALRAAEELISLPESGQDLLAEAGSRYGSSILSGEKS